MNLLLILINATFMKTNMNLIFKNFKLLILSANKNCQSMVQMIFLNNLIRINKEII